jgi:hypothetical protein
MHTKNQRIQFLGTQGAITITNCQTNPDAQRT